VLQGLKVVELATYIAAPGAGGIMADWGRPALKATSELEPSCDNTV
jgi:crotonobetainyl-CoA:carnitine CoA-transferase CaiB-like acyl-CoA transferase